MSIRPSLAFAIALGIALIAATLQTLAAESIDGFPTEARPLSAEALQQRLAGKVFGVKPATGSPWRLQFQTSGYYFIDAGNFRDKGNWRVEQSRLCTAPQTRPAGCNDMRLIGETLVMKRDSGEIVKFEPN